MGSKNSSYTATIKGLQKLQIIRVQLKVRVKRPMTIPQLLCPLPVEERAFRPALRGTTKWASAPGVCWDTPTLELP
jgi:hypothetical protein